MNVGSPAHMKYVCGFTLIELLVVIAIIGVLSTMIIGALGDARSKARDAQRVRDIRTIQTALEMYYLEHGEYPSVSSSWHRSNQSLWTDLQTLMGLSKLPRDPVNTGTFPHTDISSFIYAYSTTASQLGVCPNNQAYALLYRLEKGSVPLSESPGVRRCDTGTLWKGGNGSITVGRSPRQ